MNPRIPRLAVFSFPRSGRGLTRKMVFPEGYPDEDTFTEESPLYQSHDFDGTDEKNDRPNLVLARSPLYCFASWFEMDARNGGIADTEEAFEKVVFETWIPYWKAFARKHILSGRAPVVWFEWFTHNPAAYAQFIEDYTLVPPANPTEAVAPERNLRDFKYFNSEEKRASTVKRIVEALQPEYSAALNLAGPFA